MAIQTNKISDNIANALIDMEFDINDIFEAIKDANERLSWKIDSQCLIYSEEIWFEAEITDVFINETTNEEWLRVKYNHKQSKNIQRFNNTIKPKDLEYESNHLIIESIENKLRQKNIELQSQTIAHKLIEKNMDRIQLQTPSNDYQCNASNYQECTVLNRLFDALKQYSMLKMINKEDQETLRRSMNGKYCTIIDDYIHFKDIHSNDLEEIYTYLIQNKRFNECNIDECDFTSRQYRKTIYEDQEKQNINALDSHLNFYRETMDSFHFYVFHCFDVGLRIKKDINDNKDDTKDNTKDDQYFDANFDRINKGILKREHITSSFHRISIKNSKYNIATELNKVNENKNDNDTMYFDHLFIHLIRVKVNGIDINELYKFMKHNEYETDSVEFDHDLKSNGNIGTNIKNNQCLNEYDEFITSAKVSATVFSVGLRYYYWDYYKMKDMKDMDKGEQKRMNNHDHSGYHYKELFVEKKYDSFKEEICSYKYILFKHYQNIKVKVKLHLQSVIIKKTSATYFGVEFLHYDIKEADPISFQHLLSLTLYTDCTDLCKEFSSTFRRNNPFESLKSMIRRNSEYYWMSKCLRECVEIYGQCRHGDFRYRNKITSLSGPFYCGVNVVMNMDSFSLNLSGPTSTSKQIEVAMKFSGVQGMVLQLDNPTRGYHGYLFGFNASWISKYPEEDERVFIGGLYQIQIQSVRIRSTKQNFEKFIYCLYCLDLMLNGSGDGIDTNERVISTINDLLNMKLSLNKSTEKTFDNYIYSTFEAFTQNKTKIILDLNVLYDLDDNLSGLLMNKMEQRKPKEEEKRKDTDLTNLFKSEIIEIFKNIQSVIIYTTDGEHSHSLSILSLLSLIDSSGISEVIVQGNDDDGFNWINDLWSASAKILKQEYKKKKYTISVKKIESEWSTGYEFVINKTRYS